jgi:hypothetical protein
MGIDRQRAAVVSSRASELDPYAAILTHAELELELAGNGDIDGLAQLAARWSELIDGLPGPPPPAAAMLIERARLINERASIELIRLREGLLLEQAAATRASRAADGYGRELRRAPQLDRSA